MSLNGTPALAEGKEIEMLIIATVTTLKRSSKKCGKNEVFDLVQSSWTVILPVRLLMNCFKI